MSLSVGTPTPRRIPLLAGTRIVRACAHNPGIPDLPALRHGSPASPRLRDSRSLVIVVWIITGPLFHFSDTWQLVINTGTTIITFLMVFLIQNAQNRDTEAIQVKLDELIRATQGAHNALLDLEELEDDALQDFRRRYQELAQAGARGSRKGRSGYGLAGSLNKGHK